MKESKGNESLTNCVLCRLYQENGSVREWSVQAQVTASESTAGGDIYGESVKAVGTVHTFTANNVVPRYKAYHETGCFNFINKLFC